MRIGHEEIDPRDLVQAAQNANVLVQRIRQQSGDLSPAYEAIEEAIAQFEEANYPVDELIPADSEPGLGFALQSKSGKAFWESYKKEVRKHICTRDGQLYQPARSALDSGVSGLIVYLMTTLGLPVSAIIVVVPMVSLIVSLGLDTWCKEPETKP
jgi:hypothetical protein